MTQPVSGTPPHLLSLSPTHPHCQTPFPSTPPLAAKGECGGRHPLAYPAPCPSELSRHARGRSSPALGSKLHCLMVQWRAGPPVSPALVLPHHAHLPPFSYRSLAGEAPRGRPGAGNMAIVACESLRSSGGARRDEVHGRGVGVDCAVCVCVSSLTRPSPLPSYRYTAGESPLIETRGRRYGRRCP